MVVDPISHVLPSTFQIEKPTTYSTHEDPPSPPDYFMLTVADDLTDYSPVSPSFSFNPDFNDLLVNQPPASTLPSEASSALCQEYNKNSAHFAQFLFSFLTYVLLSYFIHLHCANIHTP